MHCIFGKKSFKSWPISSFYRKNYRPPKNLQSKIHRETLYWSLYNFRANMMLIHNDWMYSHSHNNSSMWKTKLHTSITCITFSFQWYGISKLFPFQHIYKIVDLCCCYWCSHIWWCNITSALIDGSNEYGITILQCINFDFSNSQNHIHAHVHWFASFFCCCSSAKLLFVWCFRCLAKTR